MERKWPWDASWATRGQRGISPEDHRPQIQLADRMCMWWKDEEDRETAEHHFIIKTWEMGMENGEGRKEPFSGKERSHYNQIATCTLYLYGYPTRVMLRGTELFLWTCPLCKVAVAQMNR